MSQPSEPRTLEPRTPEPRTLEPQLLELRPGAPWCGVDPSGVTVVGGWRCALIVREPTAVYDAEPEPAVESTLRLARVRELIGA